MVPILHIYMNNAYRLDTSFSTSKSVKKYSFFVAEGHVLVGYGLIWLQHERVNCKE